jgi:hypothetical protein
MSKYGSAQFAFLLNDGYDLTASLSESASISKESITQQTNPFGATSEEHTPVNLTKGMLTIGDGFFDAATDALHHVFGVVLGVSRIVCATIEGNIIGRHFHGFEGTYSQKFEVKDFRDGLTKAQVTYLVSGDADEGVIVQHLATFTADWDTKTGGAGAPDAPVDYTTDVLNRSHPITSNSIANPTVVTCAKPHNLTTGDIVLIADVITSSPTINGSRTVTVIDTLTFSVPVNVTVGGTGGTFVKVNSIGGGVGYLQCTAFSGFSGVVPKIMHSPDDSTYATLITFATLAAIGKERKTVTGTIDRYLSFNGDVTGSGSITLFGGLARNN